MTYTVEVDEQVISQDAKGKTARSVYSKYRKLYPKAGSISVRVNE